jgi:hypothetical protein
MVVTTGDATIAASQSSRFQYKIEGYDFKNIAQREFTISFWVRAVTTGTYCVAFVNGGFDRSYVAEYTIDTTDTWEFKTITVPASPAAGTWDYTNGIGLHINFTVATGTTYHTTAGSWQTGLYFGTSSQVNGIAANTDRFYLQFVQVEEGAAATPFEIRSRAEELALCQRYYFKTFSQGTAPANGAGTTGALTYRATLSGINVVSERAHAANTLRSAIYAFQAYNPVSGNSKWYNNSLATDSGASSFEVAGENWIALRNTQLAGDLAGHLLSIHYTIDAEL